MKKLRQLMKELPSKKVVFALGRFQPPTVGHALLISAVKKISSTQKADHVIFVSSAHDKKTNPLSIDKKLYYLNRIFHGINFTKSSSESDNILDIAKMLSKKYKNIIFISGSDKASKYKSILDKSYRELGLDTIEVISYGEKDPDSDDVIGLSSSRLREAAKKGDVTLFRKGLPHTITKLDSMRLMNDIRNSIGAESVKEHIKFETTFVREKYVAGKIFKIGDRVSDGNNIFEVVDRGSNYITVVNSLGDISKKWLDSVQPIEIKEDISQGPVPKEISYKGYTTKNLHHSEDSKRAFIDTINRTHDPVAVLNALKATDVYMGLSDKHLRGEELTQTEIDSWMKAHEKARESLNKVGEFAHHEDYWHMHQHELEGLLTGYKEAGKEEAFGESYKESNKMKFSLTDKIKIARIIASSLGIENTEKSSDADQLINTALRKIKNKSMRPEYVEVIHNMLQTAAEAGIEYDKNLLPSKMKEQKEVTLKNPNKNNESDVEADVKQKASAETAIGSSYGGYDDTLRRMKIKYHLGEAMTSTTADTYEGMSDIEGGESDLRDKDIDDIVGKITDDDYLEAYDDAELAVVDHSTGEYISGIKEEVGPITEVLSRAERIRAKVRFAKSEAKRERKTQIALRTRSSSSVMNRRARRLAVELLKKRIAKKPLEKLSVSEKERIEAIIAKRKNVLNRIAMKLVPHLRKIENERLVHKNYTK